MQYHPHSKGSDAAAFRRAFAKATAEASATGVNELIFLVHSLQMLEGDAFEEVLGEKFVAAFAKNKVAAVPGVRLHLETERVRSAADAAVVFARSFLRSSSRRHSPTTGPEISSMCLGGKPNGTTTSPATRTPSRSRLWTTFGQRPRPDAPAQKRTI